MENKSGIDNLLRVNSERKLKKVLLISIAVVFGLVLFSLAFSYFSYDEQVLENVGFGADIDDVFLSDDGKNVNIGLVGGANLKNVSRVKFVFKSGGKEYVYETEEGIGNISVPYNISFLHKLFSVSPDYKGGYGYNISLDKIEGLSDFEDVEEISVVFEYVDEITDSLSNVDEVVSTPVLDKEKIKKVVSSGGGGGGGSSSGGSSGGSSVCVLNCVGKECGDDGCGGSCGGCDDGYSCNESGQCVEEVGLCVPTTCLELGYECGIWVNGTCAGSLSCGDCSSGYICVGGSCVEQSGDISIELNASRVSGVAPLGVFFDTEGTVSPLTNKPIHDLDYSWDFGIGTEADVSSGGRFFSGFNSAHIFETAGIYDVVLTVKDAYGNVAQENVSIEVLSEPVGGWETYCFSNDVDFAGCPDGATQVQTDYWYNSSEDCVLNYVGQSHRLLLKRGDVFNYSEECSGIGNGPMLFSVFGSGEKPKIKFNGTRENSWEQNPLVAAGKDVRFTDIYFDLYSGTFGGMGAEDDNFLLLRVISEGASLGMGDNIFVVDSNFSNIHWTISHTDGEKIVVMNSDFGPSCSHSVYGFCQPKAIFFGNDFHDAEGSATGVRLAANLCSSKNILVSNNMFRNLDWYAMEIWVSTDNDERFREWDIVIEKNNFLGCGGIEIVRDHGYENISVRNNIFNVSKDNIAIGLSARANYHPAWAKGVERLWVYNNLFYGYSYEYPTWTDLVVIEQGDLKDVVFENNIFTAKGNGNVDGWIHALRVNASAIPELAFKNNLYYFPDTSSEKIFHIDGVDTGNLSWWQDYGGYGLGEGSIVGNPLFVNDSNGNFKLQENSPAVNAGRNVSSVFYDIDGIVRGDYGSWDIGPYEYVPSVSSSSSQIIANHTTTNITAIPESAILQAKQNLHIGYGHTSHGSQLTTGMSGLVGFANNGGLGLNLADDIFAYNNGGSGGALDLEEGNGLNNDVGYAGWDDLTRSYLDDPSHSDVNVIIWSWCGQVNSPPGGDLQAHYLEPMATLESEYPDVTFVYMTGHLEGLGFEGSVFAANEQIRDWVKANESRVLYDFADIEKYDPDKQVNYMQYDASDNCDYDFDEDGTRESNWATTWQGSHTQDVDWYSCSCAHSQSLNCNQKAYAAWYLWARLGGWDGVLDGEQVQGSSFESSSSKVTGYSLWERIVRVF